MVQIKESVMLFQSGTPLNKPKARERPFDRLLHLAHALVACRLATTTGHALPSMPAMVASTTTREPASSIDDITLVVDYNIIKKEGLRLGFEV